MCLYCSQLTSLALSRKSHPRKIFFSCKFVKGIFFVEMQAERRAFGPKIVKKTSNKDQSRKLMKMFNDKSWPQQEDVFCNLTRVVLTWHRIKIVHWVNALSQEKN